MAQSPIQAIQISSLSLAFAKFLAILGLTVSANNRAGA
jgi:hypothetical protein